MTISYEWCVEETEGEDIADNHFQDSLADCIKFAGSDSGEYKIVLTVCEWNEDEGVTGRSYAYVTNGQLPEYSSGDFKRKIPKKFQTEFAQSRQRVKSLLMA